jgi:hypothetical protein
MLRRVAQVPREVRKTNEDGCPRCLAFGHLGEHTWESTKAYVSADYSPKVAFSNVNRCTDGVPGGLPVMRKLPLPKLG